MIKSKAVNNSNRISGYLVVPTSLTPVRTVLARLAEPKLDVKSRWQAPVAGMVASDELDALEALACEHVADRIPVATGERYRVDDRLQASQHLTMLRRLSKFLRRVTGELKPSWSHNRTKKAQTDHPCTVMVVEEPETVLGMGRFTTGLASTPRMRSYSQGPSPASAPPPITSFMSKAASSSHGSARARDGREAAATSWRCCCAAAARRRSLSITEAAGLPPR